MKVASISYVALDSLKELTQILNDGHPIYLIAVEALRAEERPLQDIHHNEKEKEGGMLENVIFRRNHNGRQLDMPQLRDWIAVNFVPHLTAKYEWFALWRILMDEGLIACDQTGVAKFARQMNSWFPDAAVTCAAAAVNLYKSGYLGSTPYRNWQRALFRNEKKDKQSMDGYQRLYRLCSELTESLKEAEWMP